jgi:predicted nucleic acid-binding protein
LAWINDLSGQLIGLDTAPLIYFVEENPKYINLVGTLFESIAMGELRAITSVITLPEVMVHPYRRNNEALALRYRDILLNSEGPTTYSLDPASAEVAAQLRATFNLRTPDAIQIATVMSKGAEFFLTNDSHLPDLPALRVLVLDELLEEIR